MIPSDNPIPAAQTVWQKPIRKGEDAMTERERACWEQFCRTGLISDYLEYRGAVADSQRTPQEGMENAAWDQSGGPFGQKPGGT